MLSGVSLLIVLVHLGRVECMARDSRVTGVFYLGDVVCVGDASMVSSAFYPWNVMWMSDAWWLFDVMPSGNVDTSTGDGCGKS